MKVIRKITELSLSLILFYFNSVSFADYSLGISNSPHQTPVPVLEDTEVIYLPGKPLHFVAKTIPSEWQLCFFTDPNGRECRFLHFDVDLPNCPEISIDPEPEKGCRYSTIGSPIDGEWKNSLLALNSSLLPETFGKSFKLRTLIRSKLKPVADRLELHLGETRNVSCSATGGYPASEISWKYGYTILTPSSTEVQCDDFSCVSESFLDFKARRLGKSKLLCISIQRDFMGNIVEDESEIIIVVYPAAVPTNRLGVGSIFGIVLGVLIFICLLLLCCWCGLLFIRKKRRKQEKRPSSSSIQDKPYTIFNPSSAASSAYFSATSDDITLRESMKDPISTNPVSEEDLCDDDELLEYGWEGWGSGSRSESLSPLHDSSISSDDDEDDMAARCRKLGPQFERLAMLYDRQPRIPNESWV